MNKAYVSKVPPAMPKWILLIILMDGLGCDSFQEQIHQCVQPSLRTWQDLKTGLDSSVD